MLYIIYRCACVCVYIYIANKKKWAFCLKCAQVAADKRNLKLPFKFQLYLQSNPSRRGFVSLFHLYTGWEPAASPAVLSYAE